MSGPCWCIHEAIVGRAELVLAVGWLRPLVLVPRGDAALRSLEAGLIMLAGRRGSTIEDPSLCSLGAGLSASNQLTGLYEDDSPSGVAAHVHTRQVVS